MASTTVDTTGPTTGIMLPIILIPSPVKLRDWPSASTAITSSAPCLLGSSVLVVVSVCLCSLPEAGSLSEWCLACGCLGCGLGVLLEPTGCCDGSAASFFALSPSGDFVTDLESASLAESASNQASNRRPARNLLESQFGTILVPVPLNLSERWKRRARN